MILTKVVNRTKQDYDIYIGRPTKWGNPFKIGKDGDRLEVIKKYETWIKKQPKLLQDLVTLEGKVLGCWCKPHACHGDILKQLIENESKK